MSALRYVGVKERGLIDLARLYLAASFGGRRRRALFEGVETFCLFIGYPRSGHSLVGSLLDAHRNAVVAHEMDVLRFLILGFGRLQLFHLLHENARQFTEEGREWTDYSYEVPGQWQGRHESIAVIGDKKGGRSVRRLDEDRDLLDTFTRTVGIPVRYVHVVRNPFDNIATRFRRNETLDLATSAERHFDLVAAVERLKARVPEDTVLDLRHEDVIDDPRRELRRLLEFLGLPVHDDYLEAAAGIVFPSRRRSRDRTDWPQDVTDFVRRRIDRCPFLAGYTFEG